MRYAVVIEFSGRNYGAHVPDLPGCIATGDSVEAVEIAIRQAIEMHLAGMREDGIAIPIPTSQVHYVDIAA